MTKFDIVERPAHYNSHPSGIQCIEIVEHMTFNLGNACKYLWRGGLKVDDATEDYRKALWYVRRSLEHDHPWLFNDRAADTFREMMKEGDKARLLFFRPSPWTEPVRRSIAILCDLHSGRVVTERVELYHRLTCCIQTAIDDAEAMGRSLAI